jgi:hypothetical protein
VSAEATMALPAADDSERQVLAALMSGDLPPQLVAEVTATLTPAAFYRSLHRDTYATILELLAGGERPDVLLVVDAMGRRGLLNGSRSPMLVRDIGAELLVAANAPVHAHRVLEAAERRRAVQVAQQVVEAAAAGHDWRAPAATLLEAPPAYRLEAPAAFQLERLDWPALIAEGVPEVEYLAAPYLPRAARVWAWGPAGAAKSMWALLEAAALSREGQVIVYVSQENPLAEELRRVALARPDLERFKLFHGQGLDLVLPEHREALLAEAVGAGLVVLDTYTACWSGDENDNAAVAAFDREALVPIAELGATALVIDHTGHPQAFVSRKGAGAGRGASAKGQKADVVLEFRAEGQRGFVIEHGKNRMGGLLVPPRGFEVHNTDDDALELVEVETSAQRAVRVIAEQMVEAITAAGVLPTRALREAATGSRDQQAEAMRLLEGEQPPRVVAAPETLDTGGGRQRVKAWRVAGALL